MTQLCTTVPECSLFHDRAPTSDEVLNRYSQRTLTHILSSESDRKTWELMQMLDNIDARFILRFRREIPQSATRTLSCDIYDALRARVENTKLQDREYSFYRKSEGEWDDLHGKPFSFFTPEVLATIFRQLAKSFDLEDAEFEPESSASAAKENYLRHLGALTDRLRQAICAGLFDIPNGKHLSTIWMSFGAFSSVFPWMYEHFCSDTLALLENQTIKQGFICADASASVRSFATFVRVKSILRRHHFASVCDETFLKDFFLREMGNFNVLDLCQTVSGEVMLSRWAFTHVYCDAAYCSCSHMGLHDDFVFLCATAFSNFKWTQKLGDGLQVALKAKICELLHAFGPLDLCVCCSGLVGLSGHFVSPFDDIFSKFASHAVRLKISASVLCRKQSIGTLMQHSAISHRGLTYHSCVPDRYALLQALSMIKSCRFRMHSMQLAIAPEQDFTLE